MYWSTTRGEGRCAKQTHVRSITLIFVCSSLDRFLWHYHCNMAAQLEWEKKLLLGTTAGTVFAFILQVVSLGTNHWLTFEIEKGLYVNKTGKYLYQFYSGLWRVCTVEFTKDDKGERIYRKYLFNFTIVWAFRTLKLNIKQFFSFRQWLHILIGTHFRR